jgi:hypothetical protein
MEVAAGTVVVGATVASEEATKTRQRRPLFYVSWRKEVISHPNVDRKKLGRAGFEPAKA